MLQNFNKLNVYQEAYSLSKDVYNELRDIEKHFRLKDQLFGSTTSVCTNIAEMSAFENKKQQKQKILICIGECNESEFWLNFCKDVGLIDIEKHRGYTNRVKKIRVMLFNLLGAIKKEIKI